MGLVVFVGRTTAFLKAKTKLMRLGQDWSSQLHHVERVKSKEGE